MQARSFNSLNASWRRPTDGCNDGDGIKESARERPLLCRFFRIVIPIPAILLHRQRHLYVPHSQLSASNRLGNFNGRALK